MDLNNHITIICRNCGKSMPIEHASIWWIDGEGFLECTNKKCKTKDNNDSFFIKLTK